MQSVRAPGGACVSVGFPCKQSVLCADETHVGDLLRMWRGLLEDDDSSDGPFAPCRIHEPGTTGGLIPWGTSRAADMFFWQVTDGAVDAWPVLARMEDAEEWNRYEMTVAEFLYRILTDPGFRPYTVADAVPEAFFGPAWMTSAAARAAALSPDVLPMPSG